MSFRELHWQSSKHQEKKANLRWKKKKKIKLEMYPFILQLVPNKHQDIV